MDLLVGTKVRFNEPYRPSQVRWAAIGVIVDMEERRTTFGPASFVRARFGDFITPWIVLLADVMEGPIDAALKAA
jgi:hypothetical protein